MLPNWISKIPKKVLGEFNYFIINFLKSASSPRLVAL